MTTATKSRVAELERAEAELEDAREAEAKASEEFRKAAAQMPNYTPPEHNPKWEQVHEARQRVAELRGLVEHLRRATLRDRLSELDLTDAEAQIRQGFETLVAGCDAYRERVDAARALCASTRPLNGRAIDADERVYEWRKLGLKVLEGEFAPAGLNQWGAARLDAALEKDADR